MRYLRLAILFFAATTSLAIAPLAWAQDEPFDGGPGQELLGPDSNDGDHIKGQDGPGNFREQLQKDLNLSEEQRQALKGLRESRKQNRELQMKIMQQRSELNDALRSGLFSESQVMDRVKEINESSAQLNSSRVKNIIALKKTLKPEQLSKLRDLMQQHRPQGQQRFDRFKQMRNERRFSDDGPGFDRPRAKGPQQNGAGPERGGPMRRDFGQLSQQQERPEGGPGPKRGAALQGR